MSDERKPIEMYRKLSTEVYALSKTELPDFIWNFYLSHAQGISGPILEPMCGSGRFLVPFLSEGYDIDGVDASADMLRACRRRCTEGGYTPELYHQYLHEMTLPRQYVLVFIPAAWAFRDASAWSWKLFPLTMRFRVTSSPDSGPM